MTNLGIYILNVKRDYAVPIAPTASGEWIQDESRPILDGLGYACNYPERVGLAYTIMGERRDTGWAHLARLEWADGRPDGTLRDVAAWDENRSIVKMFRVDQ